METMITNRVINREVTELTLLHHEYLEQEWG